MPKTYCPECDAPISVDEPVEGDMLECPECGVELEVIDVEPFEVDLPLDEDWEDDWEDYDDDDEEEVD